MEQEGHVPANKRTEKDTKKKMTYYNAVDKSVCSSVVDLTDDAWLLVLSYLGTADKTRVARVCTRWRELARISWKSITRLSFEDTKDSELFVRRVYLPQVCLPRCGPRLQCLDLSRCVRGYRITPRFLDLVGLHCASLQELNLSYCGLDNINTALKTLAERLPRLRSLCLSFCYDTSEERDPEERKPYYPTSFTDKGVRILAERCPNLEAINISWCRGLTRKSIRHLVENCPKLLRLMCYSSFEWDESTIVTLFKLPLLEKLRVSSPGLVPAVGTAVTDQLFCELSRHCPRLTAISLWGCDNLTGDAFSDLCPWLHLESIDLSLCEITDKGLIQLSSTHPQLKTVNLSYCRRITDKGVGRLVSDHPNLLELDIRSCDRVTDGVLPMLQSSLQHRQYTQPLRISLSDTLITSEKLDVFRENTKCIVNPTYR